MEENSALVNEDNMRSPLIVNTPKSQNSNSDVRRWASVVKAHKTILNSPEVKRFVSGKDEAVANFDSVPDSIFENYENHKGFITFNKNSFFCQICSLDLDTMISLTNHLKTRKHEDNVIVFLKKKLPNHLEHMMEFVSFCKYELCCNLCQETIEMSLNAHETLLNIIAHNMDMTHASHDGHSLAHHLLNFLSENCSEIIENLHFIDKKIMPLFKCKLCNKNITYNENVDLLEKHLISHFKSLGHVKNQKAVAVLKLFEEVSIQGKEKFVLMNGNIICTLCNIPVDTDVDNLVLHIKGVEHASNSLADLKLFSALDIKNDNNGSEENEVSIKKSNILNLKCEEEKFKRESEEKINTDSKMNRLMSILPPDSRHIDYLIENDKGSVTCLICNCVVPPCKHNLLIHLNGTNHQRKLDAKYNSKLVETKNLKTSQAKNRESLQDPSLKMLLKSLPDKLGNVNYIVKKIGGGTRCLVCQCDLPLVPSEIEEHLRSLIHVKMENLWLEKCPGCRFPSDKFISDILKIPKELRVYQCRSLNTTVPASTLDHFNTLLKKHSLISNNKDLLVINVDGKNIYCKLCKSLMLLSSDISDFEKNLVSHLLGKTHLLNGIKHSGKKLEEEKKTPHSSSSGKVVRSLFLFSNGDEKKTADTKIKVCEGLSSFNKETFNFCTTPSLKRKTSTSTEPHISLPNKNVSDVFIFGKNNKDDQYNLENLENKNTVSKSIKKHKALPIKTTNSWPTFELETDEAVLSRRQKQVDYGKNTEGYARYRKAVPFSKRRLNHPATPPKHIKCSRRTWDGLVRAWRKKLHSWDLPRENTSLEQDIQPLPLQV